MKRGFFLFAAVLSLQIVMLLSLDEAVSAASVVTAGTEHPHPSSAEQAHTFEHRID